MITYVLVALGLSMDAFAVSVSGGNCYPRLRLREAVRSSLLFGFFQFFMPIAGWLFSSFFSTKVESYFILDRFRPSGIRRRENDRGIICKKGFPGLRR